MAKYRKKPVVIEAFKWMTDEVPEWWKSAKNVAVDVATGSAFIPTLEGTHEARPGDYIIQGIKGELYPCKPDIFAATYEPVEGTEVKTELSEKDLDPTPE
jgi:hypothetical protein